MIDPRETLDFNLMLHRTAEELHECQEDLLKGPAQAEAGGRFSQLHPDQQESIDHLMDTLENANIQLAKEISSERVVRIDPEVMAEIDNAIEAAMGMPTLLDAKISEVYFSIFGLNTPLWQVLREMQRLLRTVDVLKDTRGKKVAKVSKGQKTKRKKRDEPG